ncbi:hypothetical protein QTO30_00790 [Yoonia sp. GPGPB17]|uniref:TadE/TadG family type IV pilus assembly protein n=1 Tax=Yoonia sp. GPGPB17 TaxID=3026147 RepID=UPI0030C1BB02
MARFVTLLKRFHDDDNGSMSVEFVLVAPILAWVFLSCIVYFDVFGVETNSLRSTITLAELFSREETVNDEFINNARSVLQELTYEESDPDYRITVFTFFGGNPTDPDDDVYRVVWADNRGMDAELTDADLLVLQNAGRLPIMSEADHNILIETRVAYDAPLSVGIGTFQAFDLADLSFTNDMLIRPRSGKLCYDPTPSFDGDETCEPP